MKKYLLLWLLVLNAPTAMGLFVGSDFEITLEGSDLQIPNPSGFINPSFNVYLTNLSDEVAIFGENIFMRGGAGRLVTLNGENAFDSEYYIGDFFDFSPFFPNGTLLPGETGSFGGMVIAFNLEIPNPSTVTFTLGHLSFSNNSLFDIPPDGDQRFNVVYSGAPVVTTLVTPIPAVGYAFLPLLLTLWQLTRKESNLTAAP